MVALAWATEVGVRRAAPLASAAIGVVVASLLGGGGYFPFPLSALLVVLLFSGGGLVLVRNDYRAVRWGLLLYGLSALVIFAVQNPVGGNITRLGALVGGPLAAAVLGARRRWWTLSVVAVPLLCWQIWPGVTAVDPVDRRPVQLRVVLHGVELVPGHPGRCARAARGANAAPALGVVLRRADLSPRPRLGAADRPARQRRALPTGPHARPAAPMAGQLRCRSGGPSRRAARLLGPPRGSDHLGRTAVAEAGLERCALAGLAGLGLTRPADRAGPTHCARRQLVPAVGDRLGHE